MINKITDINFGIFKNFNWDSNFNHNIKFEKINIIYGRNYSGKTTLSRILRGVETGYISEKYINPKFKLEFDDNNNVTQENYKKSTNLIRVFNEDFIRENLSFPYNDDGEIKSFTLLGKENVDLQKEIKKIEEELGANTEVKTGLYKELETKSQTYQVSMDNLKKARDDFQQKLTRGASVIGNNSRTYNRNNLQQEINIVLDDNYKNISDNEKEKFNSLIKENGKKDIEYFLDIQNNFQLITNEVKEIVEHKVGDSEKIEELVKNAELNRWVKEGKNIQKGRSICAFCGNTITDERWKALDKHFDEEYEKLDKQIIEILDKIETEKNRIMDYFKIEKENYYSQFEDKVSILKETAEKLKIKIENFYNTLHKQLLTKQNAMLETIVFQFPDDVTSDLNSYISEYNKVAKENNDYTSQLSIDQETAKKRLHLSVVYDFCEKIGYKTIEQNLSSLEEQKQMSENEFNNINTLILEKQQKIEELNSTMSNEKEGAKKINNYMSLFFDANHLSLEVINEKNENDEKQSIFSILRDGKKAFNLSEGECHIIAFCYFMAKLQEVKDLKPIIWIDDPICSLDDNHIFSVYSALYSNLIIEKKESDGTTKKSNIYDQIFISTHSLNFLKYLKRYKGEENQNKQYFIIQRKGNSSFITKMPKYLQEYATEFNYLFKQIYVCSQIEEINDENYTLFYNIGNNARKFLEIYSYYKFPDMYNKKNSSEAEDIRLKKLWGNNTFDAILTGRLNNEYSHLAGSIERGEQIVDVPEIKKVAISICNKLEEIDKEQYDALINSVKE